MSAVSTDEAASWDACAGDSGWIAEALRGTLSYATPLPVQQAVIPTVAGALLSGIPMDVSLTAPTGSGKTLCYLLPMLRMITAEKKGLNDVRLRALILVPTKTLGQQVHREVSRLTRHTTIATGSLCADADSFAAEAEALVRAVHVGDAADVRYFSMVDVLVATPQRLLRHLDGTPGLSLAALRLLVIDEADQVLAGTFGNLVVKVVERFDEERAALAAQEQASVAEHLGGGLYHRTGLSLSRSPYHTLHKMICSATLSSRIGRISEVRLRNCRVFALDTNGCELPEEGTTITIPASAGSSSAGKKTSQTQVVKTAFALPPTLQEHIVFVEDSYRHAVLLKLVRTILQLQAQEYQEEAAARARQQRLQGRSDSDDDDDDKEEKKEEEQEEHTGHSASGKGDADKSKQQLAAYPVANRAAGTGILVFCSSAEEARVMGHFLSAAGVQRVVEFTTLTTESERRHALLQQHTPSSSTAAPSPPSDSSPALSSSGGRGCGGVVVASDALMRGIDIPNTGHVIMYHPPASLSQYVHRAGRTARAMRPGHLHVLLSKLGPSGTQEDGEVAGFRKLSAMVTRTAPQRYERHFFLFEVAPHAPAATPAAAAVGTKTKTTAPAKADADPTAAPAGEQQLEGASGSSGHTKVRVSGKDSAEWWVTEANRYLDVSQEQLRVKWASVLEAGEAAGSSSNNNNNNKRPREA